MMKEYSEPNMPALEQASFKIRMEEGRFLPPGTAMGRDDMPEGVRITDCCPSATTRQPAHPPACVRVF